MKRMLSILLALLIVLVGLPAFASSSNGQGDMLTRSGELAAFLDSEGYIYISGEQKPRSATKAERLVSIDPYRILFFAKSGFPNPEGRLISLDLTTLEEITITDDAYAACLEGENVYYISRSNRTKLFRYNLDTHNGKVVHTASEALDRLYLGLNGVIATQVEGSGAVCYDAMRDSFLPYGGEIALENAVYDDFEVYLTDSRRLYVLTDGMLSPIFIDSGIKAWAVIGSSIYYLTGTDAYALSSYDVRSGLRSSILAPQRDMEPQLTSSQRSLFMLATDNTVFSVDIRNKRLERFTTLPSLSSYAAKIDGYRIEAVSGQLNIYGVVKNESTLPSFTFVDFTAEVVEEDTSKTMLLTAYTIDNESTVLDLLKPAPQFSPLRKGNRGQAVSAIQQPLYDLGYYNYYIDGIFGWRTERAVVLLQYDLGLAPTGIADENLQRVILSGTLEKYDPFRGLREGSRGPRVVRMQQSLRDLGYLADDADGVYGPRTAEAVLLFQEENRLKANGIANKDTLRKLFSDNARYCSSYIELRKGDSCYRVRELNARLKALYYLEGDVSNRYSSATADAVRRFQQEVGLRQDGHTASPGMQQRLFSRNAPEYSGYLTLRRGDENARVKDLQRRLMDLGYYDGKLSGYFDKNTQLAVQSFQYLAGERADGVATPETLEKLYSDDAPIYTEPVEIGYPVFSIDGVLPDPDNGVYYFSEENANDGKITIAWYTEGDVEDYNVRIEDRDDPSFTQDTETGGNLIIVALDELLPDHEYSITVTARPINKNVDTEKSSTLLFALKQAEEDEIGIINRLIINPQGDGISLEAGTYAIPADELGMLYFNWIAEGDVLSYAFDIKDSQENLIAHNDDPSVDQEGTNLSADALDTNEYYTLSVYAIPTNGTIEDAFIETISFRLKPAAEPMYAEIYVEDEGEDASETQDEGIEAMDASPSDPEAAPEVYAAMAYAPEESASVDPAVDDYVPEEYVPEEYVPEEYAPEVETPEEYVPEEYVPEEYVPEEYVPEEYVPEEYVPEEYVPEEYVPEEHAAPMLSISPVLETASVEFNGEYDNDTYEVTFIETGVVQLTWEAAGNPSDYLLELGYEDGELLYSGIWTETGSAFDSSQIDAGTLAYMHVVANFADGASTEATLYFVRRSEESLAAENEAYTAPEESASDDWQYDDADYASYDYDAASEDEYAPAETEDYSEPVDESNYDDSAYDYETYDYETYDYAAEDEAVDSYSYDTQSVETEAYDYSDDNASTSEQPEYDDRSSDYEDYSSDYEDYSSEYDDRSSDYEDYSSDYEDYSSDYEDYGSEHEDYSSDYEDYGSDYEDYGSEYDDRSSDYEDTSSDYVEQSSELKPIDRNSSYEDIKAVQDILLDWGWLEYDSYAVGSLDDATMQAVMDFETYCSELGMEVSAISIDRPVIGIETLRVLNGNNPIIK